MEINAVELACNLATLRVINALVLNIEFDYRNKEDLLTTDESGTQIWKEYPQKVFNRWYDYYLGEIEKCKV